MRQGDGANASFPVDTDAVCLRNEALTSSPCLIQEFLHPDVLDDIDDDPRTIHVTLYDANALVGCARTFPDPDRPDQPGRWVFGRLAVLPEARRGGFGAALLAESERLAREAGATEMHLHAQCRVTPFYGRMGYAQYGPVELDEHVEHIWMEKLLDETGGRG